MTRKLGTEYALSSSLAFPLLELQEDSNLARRLKIKLWHKTKYGKSHTRRPNVALGEIKGKGGYRCLNRDPFMGAPVFALGVEGEELHRQGLGSCLQVSRLYPQSRGPPQEPTDSLNCLGVPGLVESNGL